MRVESMTESKYLKQSDVDGDLLVTISKIGKVNLAKEGDAPEYKWAMKFEELQKPLILNATNLKRLARACNSQETDDWIGKKILLYVDPDIEFGGNVVGGIRVKAAENHGARQVPGKGKGPMGDMADDVPW